MKNYFLIFAFLFATPVFGQQRTIILTDGSRLNGIVSQESLEVLTKYGKLTIPWKDINEVKLGCHYSEGLKEEIDKSIINLGSSVYKERQQAENRLFNHAKVCYHTLISTKPIDQEAQKRLSELIKKIEEKIPIEEIRANFDLLSSSEGDVKGNISQKTIKIKTQFLGELELPLYAVERFVTSSEVNIKLNATKYGTISNDWYNTGIFIRRSLTITAEGIVDMWPQQAGQHMSTPKGIINNKNGNYNIGQLIGKIGPNGDPFEINDLFDNRQNPEGYLYLRINHASWAGSVPTGHYEIKVKSGL